MLSAWVVIKGKILNCTLIVPMDNIAHYGIFDLRWLHTLSDDNAPTTSTSSDNMQTTSESDDGAKVWCFCKQDKSYGNMMIGCDNPACPIQWFHLSCLKLEQHQVPKGKWYCPL